MSGRQYTLMTCAGGCGRGCRPRHMHDSEKGPLCEDCHRSGPVLTAVSTPPEDQTTRWVGVVRYTGEDRRMVDAEGYEAGMADPELHERNRLAHEVARAAVDLHRKTDEWRKCKGNSKQENNAATLIVYASQTLERHTRAYEAACRQAQAREETHG